MNPLFLQAIPLLEEIEAAGYEAYFVGGAVRDTLLHRPINDVDIATSATPDELKQIFPNTVDVGIEHGTILVLYNGGRFEITTFRAESAYKDHRRPDEVYFIRSLKEDLNRRDFTMNAIAMNKKGELSDPFHGQQAIVERRIETVGKAEERFSEDALRMMRAIRFVSQLSFSLDKSCIQALEKMGFLLEHIAVERKSAEFEKLLAGKNRINAVDLLCKLKLDQYLPGLKPLTTKISNLCQYQCEDLDIDELWVLLLYSVKIKAENIDRFLRNWKLPIKRIRKIQEMTQWVHHRFVEKWDSTSLYDAGKQMVTSSEKVYKVINQQDNGPDIYELLVRYDALPIKSRSELEVSGKDLMTILDRQAGPWIKEVLRTIELAILNEDLENKREIIREWVLSCNLK